MVMVHDEIEGLCVCVFMYVQAGPQCLKLASLSQISNKKGLSRDFSLDASWP